MKEPEPSSHKKEVVLARLKLAQSILEDSDRILGFKGYNLQSEKWWLHPRHEREALVVYLLLTCFDLIGQTRYYISFSDWLNSNKPKHKDEREEIFNSISLEIDKLAVARHLHKHYEEIYGVRNSFYQGILSLNEESREKLFRSVEILYNPEFGKYGPNVSTPGFPIEDKAEVKKLVMKYIYQRRNRFTHKLEQHHTASAPIFFMQKGMELESQTSWVAIVRDGKLSYMSQMTETFPDSKVGAYCYTLHDWPFVLFEVLYDLIGYDFDRTSIKLKFRLAIWENNLVEIYENIEHAMLKDFKTLLTDLRRPPDCLNNEEVIVSPGFTGPHEQNEKPR